MTILVPTNCCKYVKYLMPSCSPDYSLFISPGPGVHPNTVLKTATRNIHSNFNFFELTLQIEEFHPNMENCEECHDLDEK